MCWASNSEGYITIIDSPAGTYDHRLRRIGHPVRSAIHKPQIGRLVVGWVTTSESLLLYVCFCIFVCGKMISLHAAVVLSLRTSLSLALWGVHNIFKLLWKIKHVLSWSIKVSSFFNFETWCHFISWLSIVSFNRKVKPAEMMLHLFKYYFRFNKLWVLREVICTRVIKSSKFWSVLLPPTTPRLSPKTLQRLFWSIMSSYKFWYYNRIFNKHLS